MYISSWMFIFPQWFLWFRFNVKPKQLSQQQLSFSQTVTAKGWRRVYSLWWSGLRCLSSLYLYRQLEEGYRAQHIMKTTENWWKRSFREAGTRTSVPPSSSLRSYLTFLFPSGAQNPDTQPGPGPGPGPGIPVQTRCMLEAVDYRLNGKPSWGDATIQLWSTFSYECDVWRFHFIRDKEKQMQSKHRSVKFGSGSVMRAGDKAEIKTLETPSNRYRFEQQVMCLNSFLLRQWTLTVIPISEDCL